MNMNKTHRCKELLEKRMSIRFCPAKGWQLNNPSYDFDYASWYLEPIAIIKFCPFCGQELK